MIIFIVSFLSFIFEYIVNLLFHGSILTGLIVFSSLVLLEPYFKKNNNRYFVFCFVLGFLYDFIYTGTYFMNAGLFLIVGFFVSYINSITPNNFLVSVLELILLIAIYRFFSFLFLCINGFIDFNFVLLFKSIYSSILVNLIYGAFLYFVLYLVSIKFHIKRINQFFMSYFLLVIL